MPTKTKLIFGLLAVFIFSATLVGGYLYLTRDNYITVSGIAYSQKGNQIATYSVNATATNADKQQVSARLAELSKQFVDELKAFGIPESDLKTTNLNIYQMEEPYEENGVTRFRKGDWSGNVTIEVILRDLDRSTELTSLIASFDSSSLWGPNFVLDNQKYDETELLAAALADARRKAQSIADATGKRLGKAIQINEGYGSGPTPYPMMYDRAVGMGGGGAEAIEVMPGSTEVSKTVTVTYRTY